MKAENGQTIALLSMELPHSRRRGGFPPGCVGGVLFWAVLAVTLGAVALSSSLLRHRGMLPAPPSHRAYAEEAVLGARRSAVSCVRVRYSVAAAAAAEGAAPTRDTSYLCSVNRAVRTSWGQLRESCVRNSLRDGRGSRFLMRAPVWQALRIAAFGALVVEAGTSSTFPFNTSMVPWATAAALDRPAVLLRHKLLLSPTYLFESTFDVLLDAATVCGVATALSTHEPAASAPSAELGHTSSSFNASFGGTPGAYTAPDAGDSLATSLLTPERHVLAFGANERRRESPFWRSVFASALQRQQAAVGGGGSLLAETSVFPPIAWCAAALLPVPPPVLGVPPASTGSSASSSSAAGALCGRAWASPRSLREGLVAFQRMLFTRPPVTRLHDRKAVLALLPTLRAEEFNVGGDLYNGVQQYNRRAINRGFNPPSTHSLAGSFLTAFNMVITHLGAMQSAVPPSEDDDAAGLFFHTTCEGEQVGQQPSGWVGGRYRGKATSMNE